MFGQNPIRKPVLISDNFFDVQEIFSTIQGEGPFAGTSSVFIRLGGCNLACKFCDTEFESFERITLDEIIDRVKKADICQKSTTEKRLIVITGGEPLRQPIERLCELLIGLNYQVQIETNGTLYKKLHKSVSIICSPKNTGTGYKNIREDLLPRISAFKFLISKSNTLYQNVEDVGQKKYKIPVYIQPMDEYNEQKNKENLDFAVKLVMQNSYKLSLQLHKYIGIK